MTLILILLVLWIGFGLLFAAGTLFLQGYFNESPPELDRLAWRAPVAATIVVGYVALWTLLATRSPERYDTIFNYSADADPVFFKTMRVVKGKVARDYYLRHNVRGTRQVTEYRTAPPEQLPLPERPDEILVQEGDAVARFLPQKDEKGNYALEKGSGILRYYDGKGRYMEEGYLGQLTETRPGATFVNLLINLLLAGAFLAAAWPVLEFSLGQSIAIAFGAWLTMELAIMPPLLAQAKNVAEARESAEQKESSGGRGESPRAKKKKGEPGSSPFFLAVESHGRFGPVSPHRGGAGPGPSAYLAATVAGNSIWTLASSPARTLTRSVRTSPLYSAFTV
jgi:hypothetical protein